MVATPASNSLVKCISFQLSRIRYVSPAAVRSGELVVTGSWMEEVNRLCLWQYDRGQLIDSGQLIPISEQEDDVAPGVLGDSLDDPRLIHALVHPGWVQDLKVHQSSQHIFTASSLGTLQVFRVDSAPSPGLCHVTSAWTPFTSQPLLSTSQPAAPLASLSLSADANHVFVGDDLGRLALVAVDRMPRAKAGSNETDSRAACLQIGSDIASLNALERIDASLLASVNQLGQLKVWDIRCGLSKPEQRLLRPSEAQPLFCLAHHPGQPHLLAVGGVQAGSGAAAYIWDLRAQQYPLTELACDGRTVWELAFHPCQPKHLYLATETAGLLQISCRDDQGCWTGFKGSRKKLTVASALPSGSTVRTVISFDLSESRIVCGHSDSIIQTVDCNVPLY